MVGPGQNEFLCDAGLLGQCLAAGRFGAFLKQVFVGLDAGGYQFLSVNGAYALNVDNFVGHKCYGISE